MKILGRPSALHPRKRSRTAELSPGAARCRRKFLRIFPGGFRDSDYISLERRYKWDAHRSWIKELDRSRFAALLSEQRYSDIAAAATKIESRTNLLFSFEKMAIRDAVKSPDGARAFAGGLFDFLHGADALELRFERWVGVVASLPRRQTRVLTWPVLTVFGFIAQPGSHFFVKPTVTRTAAERYGFELRYRPRPSWEVYASMLEFAHTVKRDTHDLHPRDMIDLQSFIWVQGSDEY